MIKKLSLQISDAKNFFSRRNTLRFQSKFTAMGKLCITVIIFLLVIIIYAYNITSSSTKGFFLSKKLNEHKELLFEQSVKKSSILLLEKKLREKVSDRTPQWHLRNKDTISVITAHQSLTKQ